MKLQEFVRINYLMKEPGLGTLACVCMIYAIVLSYFDDAILELELSTLSPGFRSCLHLWHRLQAPSCLTNDLLFLMLQRLNIQTRRPKRDLIELQGSFWPLVETDAATDCVVVCISC